MGIWDKYKLNDLPEDQRGEVIKVVAKELEETNRARLNSGNHQTVRGMAVVGLVIVATGFGLFGYWSMQEWKEVRVKSLTPMVCPAPPPCPAAPIPSFDIKVTPATPPAK
jgi:hypothetical protein